MLFLSLPSTCCSLQASHQNQGSRPITGPNVLLQHCGTDRNAGLIRSVILKSWWYITLHGRAAYQLPLDNVWMHPVLSGRGSENTYHAVSGIVFEASPGWVEPSYLSILTSALFTCSCGQAHLIGCLLCCQCPLLGVRMTSSQGPHTLEARLLGVCIIIVSLLNSGYSAPLSSLRIFILTVALLVLHLNNRVNDVIFWTNSHTNWFFSISPSLIKFRGQCFCH